MNDTPGTGRPGELPTMGTGGGIMPGPEPSTAAMEPGTGSLIDDMPTEPPDVRESLRREGDDTTAWPGQEGWTGDREADSGDGDVDADESGGAGAGI